MLLYPFILSAAPTPSSKSNPSPLPKPGLGTSLQPKRAASSGEDLDQPRPKKKKKNKHARDRDPEALRLAHEKWAKDKAQKREPLAKAQKRAERQKDFLATATRIPTQHYSIFQDMPVTSTGWAGRGPPPNLEKCSRAQLTELAKKLLLVPHK